MDQTQGLGEHSLELQTEPNPKHVQVVAEGHMDVLAAQVGSRRREPFALILRSDDGTVVGGLVGKLLFDDLHVDQVWLDESVRGRGYGRSLMEQAEEHAARGECDSIYLNTISKDVLSFCEHLGYSEMGRMADLPIGHTVYFLKKSVSRA